MTAYVEADRRIRAIFLSAAVSLVVVGLLLKLYVRSLPPPSGPPAAVLQVAANHALVMAVFFTVLFICWAAAVVWIASRTVQSGRWPPMGLRMPFRARVYQAPRRTVVLLVAAVFLGAKGAVAVLAWQHFLAVKHLAGAVL